MPYGTEMLLNVLLRNYALFHSRHMQHLELTVMVSHES